MRSSWTVTWWTQEEAECAAGALAAALRAWAADWGIDVAELGVARATQPWLGAWQCVAGQDDVNGVWLGSSEQVLRDMAPLWGGSRTGSRLVNQVALKAVSALGPVLRKHFSWVEPELNAAVAPHGRLDLDITLGDTRLCLALSAGIARLLCQRKVTKQIPVGGMLPGLADRTVPLTVVLKPVVLEVGGLCSLAPGDVVLLNHRLDEPVRLQDLDGDTLMHAHLVRCAEHKAVQLDRPA